MKISRQELDKDFRRQLNDIYSDLTTDNIPQINTQENTNDEGLLYFSNIEGASICRKIKDATSTSLQLNEIRHIGIHSRCNGRYKYDSLYDFGKYNEYSYDSSSKKLIRPIILNKNTKYYMRTIPKNINKIDIVEGKEYTVTINTPTNNVSYSIVNHSTLLTNNTKEYFINSGNNYNWNISISVKEKGILIKPTEDDFNNMKVLYDIIIREIGVNNRIFNPIISANNGSKVTVSSIKNNNLYDYVPFIDTRQYSDSNWFNISNIIAIKETQNKTFDLIFNSYSIWYSRETVKINGSVNDISSSIIFKHLKPNTKYNISFLPQYDGVGQVAVMNKNITNNVRDSITFTTNEYGIYNNILFSLIPTTISNLRIDDIQLSEGETAKQFIQGHSDTIDIIIPDTPIKSIPCGAIDYYIKGNIQRQVEEVILTGYEDWKMSTTNGQTHSWFYIIIPFTTTMIVDRSLVNMNCTLCNNLSELEALSGSKDKECCFIRYEENVRKFYITVNNSKLETRDVLGFKKLLRKTINNNDNFEILLNYEADVYSGIHYLPQVSD